MDELEHKVELTSAEIANLWTQYMNDSLSYCIMRHSINCCKDQEIKELLDFAASLSESHLEYVREKLSDEGYATPKGYSLQEDVNLNAPPLFTDTFMLIYMHVMALLGLTGYAGAISTSCRIDQIEYFFKCNIETTELYKRTIEVMLRKGVYSRPPRINKSNQVDFVNNRNYLTGWFGKKRPLNAIEISGVSFNMIKVIVKVVLEIGFSQVCKTKEVKEYFRKGKNICEKQFGVLSAILTKDELASPASWVSEITDSTVAPYSDKLMLNHIVILISAAIGYYGAGAAVSQRRDLAMEYAKLMGEVSLYAEDGAELLIKYGWLEQPPLAVDREKLASTD